MMKSNVVSSTALLCTLWAWLAPPPALPAGGSGTPLEESGGVRKIPVPSADKKVDLPEIPEEQLPARTRIPPDPEKTQYVRGKVFIELDEEIRPMSGGVHSPEVLVTQNYLSEYFRRAGYEVADSPEKVDYRIAGEVVVDYETVITFRENTIGWTYKGTASIKVKSRQGNEVDAIEVPETSRTSSVSEKRAILDTRRYLAKLLYEQLFVKGDIFAEEEVVELVQAIATDPLQSDQPVAGGEIIPRLADIGLPAVPYLLEAMTDTRTVVADIDYPDLENPELLKVYHVADKTLEEIFQKVSRLPLRNSPEERFVVTLGWENEWRRFCPPFRDSPLYKLRLKRWAESRKKAGASTGNDE